MQARTAPTSPAAKKNTEAVTKVWTDSQIQQPPQTPWGKLALTVIVLTLIFNIVTVVGFGWYVHRYPQTWLTRFAPLTSTTTTTVVQPVKENSRNIVPAAVLKLAGTAYGLARNQGQDGVYRQTDILGLAWPLSSSGWTVSVNGAWPADVKSLSLVPTVGQTQAITSTVSDPGSQYVFLKSTELSAQPVSLGSMNDVVIGSTVWVVDQHSAVARQIIDLVQPRWASSDRDETYIQLDSPVELASGSAVVTTDGRFIGLLGVSGRVWPMPGILTVVKQVVQQATVSRPVVGIKTLNLSMARVTGDPTASGFLIGADEGEAAIALKSPAELAGLKSGDIITAIDNQMVDQNIFSALMAYQPGEKITVTYLRQQKSKTATITLGSTRS